MSVCTDWLDETMSLWVNVWVMFNVFATHVLCSGYHLTLITGPKNNRVQDTWYLWGKNSENMQLLDVLVCNSANKPSFQNPTGQTVQNSATPIRRFSADLAPISAVMLVIFGIDFTFFRIDSFRFHISGSIGPTGKYNHSKCSAKPILNRMKP